MCNLKVRTMLSALACCGLLILLVAPVQSQTGETSGPHVQYVESLLTLAERSGDRDYILQAGEYAVENGVYNEVFGDLAAQANEAEQTYLRAYFVFGKGNFQTAAGILDGGTCSELEYHNCYVTHLVSARRSSDNGGNLLEQYLDELESAYQRGYLNEITCHPEAALEEYAASDQPRAAFRRGMLLEEGGEFEEAVGAYREASSGEPESEVDRMQLHRAELRLGTALYKNGAPDVALRTLEDLKQKSDFIDPGGLIEFIEGNREYSEETVLPRQFQVATKCIPQG